MNMVERGDPYSEARARHEAERAAARASHEADRARAMEADATARSAAETTDAAARARAMAEGEAERRAAGVPESAAGANAPAPEGALKRLDKEVDRVGKKVLVGGGALGVAGWFPLKKLFDWTGVSALASKAWDVFDDANFDALKVKPKKKK